MTVRSLANRCKAAAGIQILRSIPTTVSPASRSPPRKLGYARGAVLSATVRWQVQRPRPTSQVVQEIKLQRNRKMRAFSSGTQATGW
jgi:hypothetical protein